MQAFSRIIHYTIYKILKKAYKNYTNDFNFTSLQKNFISIS